jgi:hypothetical protein
MLLSGVQTNTFNCAKIYLVLLAITVDFMYEYARFYLVFILNFSAKTGFFVVIDS